MYNADMLDYLNRRQHIAIEPAMERQIAQHGLATYRIRQDVKRGNISVSQANREIAEIVPDESPMVNKVMVRELDKDAKTTVIPIAEEPKGDTVAPGIVGVSGKKLGGSLICVAIIIALGYLILGGKR